MEGWKVATRYQQFYKHWRDSSASSRFRKEFLYKLSLGEDSDGASLLPFCRDKTSGNQILVTTSYNIMFHRLVRLRRKDKGTTKGAVLTGQPGVGASL